MTPMEKLDEIEQVVKRLQADRDALLEAARSLLEDIKSVDADLHWRMAKDPETVKSIRELRAAIAQAEKGEKG